MASDAAPPEISSPRYSTFRQQIFLVATDSRQQVLRVVQREIAENLHRADLTAQERADHIAEWVRITGEKQAQLAPVSDRGRVEGRGNKGGINAAVRDLGIDRTEAQRAVKIASIAPEAKEAGGARMRTRRCTRRRGRAPTTRRRAWVAKLATQSASPPTPPPRPATASA